MKNNGLAHVPDADEEPDPVEATDFLPMSFQAPLPDGNCFGCPDDVSDEYCAACMDKKRAAQENSPDRLRLVWGKNTPKSPRAEPVLALCLAKPYAHSSAPAYRGNMSNLILDIAGRTVFI